MMTTNTKHALTQNLVLQPGRRARNGTGAVCASRSPAASFFQLSACIPFLSLPPTPYAAAGDCFIACPLRSARDRRLLRGESLDPAADDDERRRVGTGCRRTLSVPRSRGRRDGRDRGRPGMIIIFSFMLMSFSFSVWSFKLVCTVQH